MHQLLKKYLLPFLLYGFAYMAHAQQTTYETDNPILNKIATPDLERRVITEDQLDSENWEIGVYTGIFSIEDFGSNSISGLRLAYHMTEDFVLEFNYGLTTAGDTSYTVRSGGIQVLDSGSSDYTYYNFSIVYNIFPGEVFIGKNTAYNTTFYLIAGAGNTTFNNNDYFTVAVGGGLRFYLTDYLALHATVKDHIFENDIIETKKTNNLEATIGLSFYF